MILLTTLVFTCLASSLATGSSPSGSSDAGGRDPIDLQLSLGGGHTQGGEASRTSFSLAGNTLSGGLSSLRDPSEATSPRLAVHIDLQRELGPSTQPRDARAEAVTRRLTELRHDLDRYFEANPETLPGASSRRKNWHDANVGMIKRQKYKEIVDAAVGNKMWDDHQIQVWDDNVPNEQPWRIKFEPMRTRYLQVQEQVALIETALIDYERSFRV